MARERLVRAKPHVYSLYDKARFLVVVDACEGNVSHASRITGINFRRGCEWYRGKNCGDVVQLAIERSKIRRNLADELEEIAYKLAEVIPEKIGSANLAQSSTSLGLVIDKMQLLRSRPTQISGEIGVEGDDDRAKRIAALLDQARARGVGQSVSGSGVGGVSADKHVASVEEGGV